MVYIQELASDSKPFHRGNTRIPVGVSLGFADTESFNTTYDQFFDSAFREVFSQPKPKTVFNSVDISSQFGGDTVSYIAFLESFIKRVCCNKDIHVNVTYSLINSQKLEKGQVKYYGTGGSAVKTVPMMKFVDDLTQYYPYIAVWSVFKQANISGTTVHLDDFQGSTTEAWEQLKRSNYLQVYPNGDLCNRGISAADLFVRYLDEKTRFDRIRIDDAGFKTILQNLGIANPHVFFVGNPHLGEIVPIEEKSLYKNNLYKRPMLFILKENIMEAEKQYVESRKETLHAIQKCAFAHSTGYKFIDYNKDHAILQDGDVVVYLGPRGKEQCTYLQDIGYNLKVYSLQDLKAKPVLQQGN